MRFDSLEQVPETMRPDFVQHEGRFVHKDVLGIIKKNEELLGEKKTLAAKYEGVDLARWQKFVEDEEAAKKKGLKTEDDYRKHYDGEIAKVREGFAKTDKEKDDRIASLTSELHQTLISAEIASALAAQQASLKLLGPHLQSSLKIVEADNKRSVVVVDSAGQPRFKDTARTQPFTVADLLEEFKKDPELQRGFPSLNRGGSGAPTKGQFTGGAGGDQKTSSQKIADGLAARSGK